jgi:hypothetical protein
LQGRSKFGLPVRLGQEVQALPRSLLISARRLTPRNASADR